MLGSGVVGRPRLTALIIDGAARGVVVLSAPLGFGATTAVADAVATKSDVAWLSLDPLDADPWHLAQRLAQTRPTDLDVSGSLAAEGSPLLLANRALTAISAVGVKTLVLDGVDARVHAPALQIIEYLCSRAPEPVGVILTTHDHPTALPLPGLGGGLTVISTDDLALTSEEARSLIYATCPDAPPESADDLVATADGWIGACRSAAQYAATHGIDRAEEWLRTEGAEQLASAILRTTTPAGARLLEETAFLDELNPPLCRAVLGGADATEALHELRLFGSLLTPTSYPATAARPVEDTWIRHPLLTGGLRARMRSRDFAAGHRRAARFYRERESFDAAMRHLLAAGDVAEAGAYLNQHEDALFESGGAKLAAQWYEALPDSTWGQRGSHLLRIAWGRATTGDARRAEASLSQLTDHLAASPALHPEEEVLRAEVTLLSAYLAAVRGDPDQTIVTASRAIAMQNDKSPVNSVQIAPMLVVKALLWRGDIGAARARLDQVRDRPFGSDLLREASLANLAARVELAEGRVTEAGRIVRRAREWLASQELKPLDVGQHPLLTAALAVQIEGGSAATAETGFEEIIDSALALHRVGDAVDALCWQARSRTATGDLPGALGCIARARRLLAENTPESALSRPLDLQEAQARHLAGDDVRAARLVRGLPADEDRMLLWARITLPRQGSSATQTLSRMRPSTPRRTAEQQILLAQAYVTRNPDRASDHLVRAADVAQFHGLGLTMLGSSRSLLNLAVRVGIQSGHDTLVTLARNAGAETPTHPARPGPPTLIGQATAAPDLPISSGEIHLLQFLPHRITNAQIAEQLNVSVNTVKTRLGRLYRKLGASNRDEAIAIARGRGLIS